MLSKQVTAVLKTLPQPPTQQQFVVGVSGGPDSLALLHMLCDLYAPAQLIVAHLDHGLRPESVEEAAFVKATTVAWGCRFHPKQVDVTKLAAENGWSIEEAGRNARYAFFAELAVQKRATAVLVAHHADDQAETVLMNLLRGAGLAGLSGMRTISPLPGRPDLLLVRPLLKVSRREIEAYCETHDLRPISDESNTNPDFLRNRVRLELIPLLADFNPHVQRHLLQLSELAAADTEFLGKLTGDAYHALLLDSGSSWLILDRPEFLMLPLSLQRRVLRQIVEVLRPYQFEISFQVIEQARTAAVDGGTGTQAPLSGDLMLTVRYDQLEIQAVSEVTLHDFPQLVDELQRPLAIPGEIELANGWRLGAKLVKSVDMAAIESNRDLLRVFVDVGEVGQLRVRSRQFGERFQPLGMNGKSAAVQDVLVNRKVAAPLRPHLPIVALPEHLVWLVGQHIDERVKVTAVTGHVVELRCYKQGA